MNDSSQRSAPPLIRAFLARPALLAALAAIPLVYVGLGYATDLRWSARAMLGWDAGVLLFFAVVVPTLLKAKGPKDIARWADRLDEGQVGTLAVCLLVTLGALVAVGFEMSAGAHTPGRSGLIDTLTTIGTVVASWLFVHTTFTLHYAHEFYGDADSDKGTDRRGGLDFPGEDEDPDYWDFFHFGFVIAVANQTADVQITSRTIRHLVTLHGVIAFLFNTIIVALLVNIAGSLLGSG